MKTHKILRPITLLLLFVLFLLSQANAQGTISTNRGTLTGGAGLAWGGPAFNVMYDHEFENWMSVGAAFTIKRSVTLKHMDAVVSDHYDKYNFAIRVLHNEHLDDRTVFYGGGRVGLSINDNMEANYTTLPSFQAVCGLRYFFTPAAGLNLEACLGSPYALSAGFSFKLP